MLLIKNDADFLQECGFLKDDNIRQCLEFKKIIIEEIEENLDYKLKEEDLFFGKKFSVSKLNNNLLQARRC